MNSGRSNGGLADCRMLGRLVIGLVLAGFATAAAATELPEGPKPVPATRPEMKHALEALKSREPRLPLERGEDAVDRPTVYNGLARRLYLPSEWYSADFRSSPDMTLDNVFKVQLFWIASRANNCQYCLGHQEKKLAMAGQTEDQIASLDVDWSSFLPGHQQAFSLARKLTLAPHEVTRDDVEVLKKHFSDAEIVEILYTVASYNSINRWTDGLGLPQDQAFRREPINFQTPTSPQFRAATTIIAPLKIVQRPPLETPEEVTSALMAAASRAPVVKLLNRADARERVRHEWTDEELPSWVQALAFFAFPDRGYITAIQAVENGGTLDPSLKARLFWTTARHNRAWYALDVALRRCEKLGLSLDEVFAHESGAGTSDPGEAAAARFAAKLTATPQLVEDADIRELREHFSDEEVAQIVYVVCTGNMFDRWTEALKLPLDAKDEAD